MTKREAHAVDMSPAAILRRLREVEDLRTAGVLLMRARKVTTDEAAGIAETEAEYTQAVLNESEERV